MKHNKSLLSLAIGSIIFLNYSNSVHATTSNSTISGGNITMNDNDIFSYDSKTNSGNNTIIDLKSEADSLKINGKAHIITQSTEGYNTAISAKNGSTVDLGSGTLVESTSSLGTILGLHIEGSNTTVNGNDLTINATAARGSASGLSLKNANVNLTGNTKINASTKGFLLAIELANNSSLSIDHLELNGQNEGGDGYGILVKDGSHLSLGDNSSITVERDNGLYATGSGTTVNVNKTTIESKHGHAVNAQANSIVNLGTGSTVSNDFLMSIWSVDNALVLADHLTVNHTGGDDAVQAAVGGVIKIGAGSHVTSSSGGIGVLKDSTFDFIGTADERNSVTVSDSHAATSQGEDATLNIKNTDIIASSATANSIATGLFSYNKGVINAENMNISIDESGFAAYAWLGGVINLSGNTVINASSNRKSALATVGSNSEIHVTGHAMINGNIFAAGSNSLIDLDITNGSIINGYTTIDTVTPGAKLNLKMTDSTWNMVNDSSVTNLNLDSSVVNFNKTGFETLTIDALQGTNGIFNIRTDIVGQEGDLLVINNSAKGNHKLTITNNGSSETDGSETLTVVQANDNQASFDLTNKVELGAYEYNLRRVNGSPNDVELYSSRKKSSSADAAGSLSTIGYLANYVENQTLLQRLGDLRNGQILNTQNHGFWIKGFGGKLNSFTGSGFSGFDADYVGTMLGADKEIEVQDGHLLVGGVVGFTKISPDYRKGSGSGKNYSASLYATYLLDNGLYVDSILKYNNLTNRFNVRDTADQLVKGTGKTQGISLSAELGKRFWLTEENQGRYIEPQIQLTYGYQNGDSVHSSNGLKVGLSHYNSILARASSILGYQTQGENPTNFYVKLGIIKEMSGSVSYRFNDGDKHSYSFNSGWFNGGLGANVNVNKQHSFYTEADYSAGHSFNNLMFNAGYRFSF